MKPASGSGRQAGHRRGALRVNESLGVQNAEAVHAFREALAEANAFIRREENDLVVRQSLAKYTKLPPQVVNTLVYPKVLDPELGEKNLQFWVDAALDQKLITKRVDINKLVAP